MARYTKEQERHINRIAEHNRTLIRYYELVAGATTRDEATRLYETIFQPTIRAEGAEAEKLTRRYGLTFANVLWQEGINRAYNGKEKSAA